MFRRFFPTASQLLGKEFGMEVERSKFSLSPATIQPLLIEHKNDAQEA